MDETEEGTVTGSIDVGRLAQIKPKTPEAKAQIDALRAQAGKAEAEADDAAEQVAAAAYAQSPEGLAEVEGTTVEAEAGPEAQSDEDAEVEKLRAEAESLGVKVDKRWRADRLRQEIDAAREG